MNTCASDADACRDEQPNDRRSDALQKRLDYFVGLETCERRASYDGHQKRRQKNADGRHNRTERSRHSIADESRGNQNWTRSDLAQSGSVDELLMCKPMMRINHLRFDQGNHDKATTKSNRAHAQEDGGEHQEQCDLGEDGRGHAKQDGGTFTLLCGLLTLVWACLCKIALSGFSYGQGRLTQSLFGHSARQVSAYKMRLS